MSIKTTEFPSTAVPIWQVPNLSKHAKVVWSAWHVGLPINDDVWRDYLASQGAPYMALAVCRDELRRNGWLA